MSGETEKNISGWTTDTLREHLLALMVDADTRNQQRFDAQQQAIKDALISQKEAVAAALVAAEKAVLVAETNAEKWRMNANEWRGSMLDRENKFAMRPEMEAELKGIRAELATLRESRAEGGGEKVGRLSSQQFMFALVGLMASLIFIGTIVVAIAYAVRR